MNISLTPEQAEYVRRSVNRDFGNASEFFRELIRERIRREINAELKLLASTSKGAEAGPSQQEIDQIVTVQKQVRQEMAHARRL